MEDFFYYLHLSGEEVGIETAKQWGCLSLDRWLLFSAVGYSLMSAKHAI